MLNHRRDHIRSNAEYDSQQKDGTAVYAGRKPDGTIIRFMFRIHEVGIPKPIFIGIPDRNVNPIFRQGIRTRNIRLAFVPKDFLFRAWIDIDGEWDG